MRGLRLTRVRGVPSFRVTRSVKMGHDVPFSDPIHCPRNGVRCGPPAWPTVCALRWGESLSTRAFWALADHLGTAVSQSAQGERLFHVRDHGYAADDPRFRGPASRKRLSFHTDRCDVIAFACLQQSGAGDADCSLALARPPHSADAHPESDQDLRDQWSPATAGDATDRDGGPTPREHPSSGQAEWRLEGRRVAPSLLCGRRQTAQAD